MSSSFACTRMDVYLSLRGLKKHFDIFSRIRNIFSCFPSPSPALDPNEPVRFLRNQSSLRGTAQLSHKGIAFFVAAEKNGESAVALIKSCPRKITEAGVETILIVTKQRIEA